MLVFMDVAEVDAKKGIREETGDGGVGEGRVDY